MEQLTVPAVTPVDPAGEQREMLAAMFSEVSAEVYCLIKQGVAIDLEFMGNNGVTLLICAPLSNHTQLAGFVLFSGIKRSPCRVHHRHFASYVFYESRISNNSGFEQTEKQLQEWLKQLNIVNRHIRIFQRHQPVSVNADSAVPQNSQQV